MISLSDWEKSRPSCTSDLSAQTALPHLHCTALHCTAPLPSCFSSVLPCLATTTSYLTHLITPRLSHLHCSHKGYHHNVSQYFGFTSCIRNSQIKSAMSLLVVDWVTFWAWEGLLDISMLAASSLEHTDHGDWRIALRTRDREDCARCGRSPLVPQNPIMPPNASNGYGLDNKWERERERVWDDEPREWARHPPTWAGSSVITDQLCGMWSCFHE